MAESLYLELGIDEDGDEHILFAWTDESEYHQASSSCGCNPDPYHDEGYPKARWWWSHHSFENVPFVDSESPCKSAQRGDDRNRTGGSFPS